MGVPARQYGTSLRHELESNIVDMMLSNFRKTYPDIMVLAGKRYEFDPKDTNTVRDWLCSKAVEEQAILDLRNVTSYSAGVARGRRQPAPPEQARLRLNYTDGTSQEVTLETVEETLEEQYRIVKTLTAENLELRNEVVRLQGLVATQTTLAPLPSNVTLLLPHTKSTRGRGRPKSSSRVRAKEKTRDSSRNAISQLALFIVLNPGVVYGARNKTEARAWIADAANAAGLRTANGQLWHASGLSWHRELLEQTVGFICEEIAAGRLAKPRFRNAAQPTNPAPFAIAAE